MGKELRQCINSYGKAKKTFDVFEDAVTFAKLQNTNPKIIHKLVAYKCKNCLKFHIGKSKHNTLNNHSIDIYHNMNT